MKLFGRTAGYYLFWTGFVYFWVGVYLAFTQTGYAEYASLGFVLALSVPLSCPPVARHFNMEPVMFDWIKNLGKPTKETYPTWADVPAWDADMKKVGDDMKKVIPFPELKSVPPVPEPPPEKDSIAYRIGKTESGKVTLCLGDYSQVTVTMNNEGVDQLIRMLEAAKSPEVDDGNDCE